MRRSLVLTVVLAAALAGCTLQGPGASEVVDSVTPAPVPTVEDDRPDVSALSIEGLANGSSVTPGELAALHEQLLAGRSVEVREFRNWSTTGVEVRDRLVTRQESTLVVPFEGYWHNETRVTTYLRSGEDANRSVDVFVNRSVGLRRTVQDGNVTVERLDPGPGRSDLPADTAELVARYLSVETATVDRITWQGQPHFRIVGRDSVGTPYRYTQDYTVRAIVQPDGLVRRLTVSFVESPMGRERTLTYTIAIDPVEIDRLEPPQWVDDRERRSDEP